MASLVYRLTRLSTNSRIFSTACNLSLLKSDQCLKNKVYNSNSIFLEIQRRNYSLKLYSQHIGEELSWNRTIWEYIKSLNNFLSTDVYDNTDLQITNVFDTESAVKQLESIILHSPDSHPDEVIKLFSLYKSYSRSKIYETYAIKKSCHLMHLKVQTTILSMSFDQLCQFADALRNVFSYKLEFFNKLESFLFEECLLRAENCHSLSEIISYFLIGCHLFHSSVSHERGYFDFIALFEKHIQEASPSQLCQILYFCGLAKKNNNKISDFLTLTASSLLTKLDEVSFQELGFAFDAMFKLNLKLDIKNGDLIKKRLCDEVYQDSFNVDSLSLYSLVSLVKYLRLIMYKDVELMNAVKSYVQHIDEKFCSPQFASHIIALYANSNHYDPDIYSALSNTFFKHLRSDDEVVRIKDISRVAWSLSHAQHQCKPEDLKLVEDTLQMFSNSSGEFMTHVSHVVDSTLYLASLGVYSEKLMQAVLQKQVVEKYKEKEKSRYLSRLLVLREVQKTFCPSLDVNLPTLSSTDYTTRAFAKEFEYRPAFRRLQSVANWLREECRTRVFLFDYLVRHVNHLSMIFCNSCVRGDPVNASEVGKHVLENLASLKEAKIAIDVNDENTSLNDGERPNGLESLKRKILKENGWDIKVIPWKDIEMHGNDDQAIAALILKILKE